MPFLSVTLVIDARCVETLSEALMADGAYSIDVADAAAGTAQEKPLFAEPGSAPIVNWPVNRVVALFADGVDLGAIVPAALHAAALPGNTPYGIDRVDDQDWVRLTQAQFSPVQISPRLWVVPTWHDVVDAAAINIRLDPGLAFGTGTHPTTRLCLRWLDTHLRHGDSVIDYGCGSGILAIAAMKLGASRALGVDIDDQALQAAGDNAARNGCAVSFQAADAAPDARAAQADIVLANILANPLSVLAPLLAGLTRPGGRVVLSGILAPQADELTALYRRWFEMDVPEPDEEWVLLAGTRRDTAAPAS